MEKVVFHLKRFWVNPANYQTGKTSEIVDLYEEIKSGRKTSEWRDFCKYWAERLLMGQGYKFYGENTRPVDLTKCLKVHRAWFVVGYPKNNVPRFEAEITKLLYHPETAKLEIKFADVKEVKE